MSLEHGVIKPAHVLALTLREMDEVLVAIARSLSLSDKARSKLLAVVPTLGALAIDSSYFIDGVRPTTIEGCRLFVEEIGDCEGDSLEVFTEIDALKRALADAQSRLAKATTHLTSQKARCTHEGAVTAQMETKVEEASAKVHRVESEVVKSSFLSNRAASMCKTARMESNEISSRIRDLQNEIADSILAYGQYEATMEDLRGDIDTLTILRDKLRVIESKLKIKFEKELPEELMPTTTIKLGLPAVHADSP